MYEWQQIKVKAKKKEILGMIEIWINGCSDHNYYCDGCIHRSDCEKIYDVLLNGLMDQ